MPVTDPQGRTVYVTGFLFASTPGRPAATGRAAGAPFRWVALILKNRPAWQAGLLNGIGGKVEPEDDSLTCALVREFTEEAGIDTTAAGWRAFARVESKRSAVHFFHGDAGEFASPSALPALLKDTDEPCSWHPVNTLAQPPMPELVIPSLRFLIPLAEQPEFNRSVTLFQWTDLPRIGEGT